MNSMIRKSKEDQDVNLLDLPDIEIDFEELMGYSCALANADELLNYLLPFLDEWGNKRYSTHQFSYKFNDQGLSLWTANDVESEDERDATFQIFVDNDKIKGYVLMHCKLSKVGALQ